MTIAEQILQAVKFLTVRFEKLKDDLSSLYLTKEAWEIYFSIINKDLNNLGNLVRNSQKEINEIHKTEADQNVRVAKITVKIALIIGGITMIVGAVVGAIVSKLIK